MGEPNSFLWQQRYPKVVTTFNTKLETFHHLRDYSRAVRSDSSI